MDFAALAELCAPAVTLETLSGIVSAESDFNPFAIGVVGATLQHQPRTIGEAVATADMLAARGYNYSLGLAQINQANFRQFGFTTTTAFDPCRNLHAGAIIFTDCLDRAGEGSDRLGNALSCYNSGNFRTGYQNGYVTKVLTARLAMRSGTAAPAPIAVIPDAPIGGTVPRARRKTPAPPEALLTAVARPRPDTPSPAATALLF